MSGDFGTWDGQPADTWGVHQLLTWSKTEVFAKNYWLAPDKKTGGQFILSLGNLVTVSNIFLVNTHNGGCKDRATRGFKVFLGPKVSGPWKQVLQGELKDSRNVEHVPPEKFGINPTPARYVKFELLSYWGLGGGLQFFAVNFNYEV